MKNLKSVPNSTESILKDLEDLQAEISALKERETLLKSNLVFAYKDQMAQALKQKDEPFGVVNFKDGDYKIAFTTPKKVKWDQKGLKQVYEDGGPVDVEFSVKEAVYKDMDDDGKGILMKYRTVEPGNVAIKIERV
jgi:hypothetical protein